MSSIWNERTPSSVYCGGCAMWPSYCFSQLCYEATPHCWTKESTGSNCNLGPDRWKRDLHLNYNFGWPLELKQFRKSQQDHSTEETKVMNIGDHCVYICEAVQVFETHINVTHSLSITFTSKISMLTFKVRSILPLYRHKRRYTITSIEGECGQSCLPGAKGIIMACGVGINTIDGSLVSVRVENILLTPQERQFRWWIILWAKNWVNLCHCLQLVMSMQLDANKIIRD